VEKMRFSPKTSERSMVSRLNVRSKVSQWTYGTDPGHMVQSVTRNFIFTSRLIAHVFLFYSCFGRNMTNIRFFTDLENPDRLEFLEMCYDPGEF
jgi:hypothetical protein